MKKVLSVALSLIIIAVVATLTVPSLRAEEQWLWVTHQNSVQSYDDYVRTWPAGRHVTEARQRIDRLRWRHAATANTIQSYEAYLRALPGGRHAAEARVRIEGLRWRNAATANTIPGYTHYLRASPRGGHAAQARRRIEGLTWTQSTTANTIASYTAYLGQYPSGRFARAARLKIAVLVAAARHRLENQRWQAALQTNTIAGYNRYLALYPAGRYARQARARAAALVHDDRPFFATERQGTRQAFEAFLAAFPGHQRTADAQQALQDIAGRNIVDLVAQGRIAIQTQGAGIQSVSLEVRRLVAHQVTVLIPAGTLFVSGDASMQNMVTTQPQQVTLADNGWAQVDVPVACTNMALEAPTNSDSFNLQKAPFQEELQQLMPVLQRANVDYPVEQAAVWIVTNDPDYAGLGELVDGLGGNRVIDEDTTARALQLLDQAGIPITQKSIWGDRQLIVNGIRDQGLKRWLQQRAGL